MPRIDSKCYAEGYLAIISYGNEIDYRCFTQSGINDKYDLETIINDLIYEVNRTGGCFQLYRRIIDVESGKFVSLECILTSPWIDFERS